MALSVKRSSYFCQLIKFTNKQILILENPKITNCLTKKLSYQKYLKSRPIVFYIYYTRNYFYLRFYNLIESTP